MVKAADAIATARALLGTPYSELDCINLIKRVIRTAPGGVTGYTTAGTNSLWKSYDMSAKYRDLTWRQEGIQGARAGMLPFKRSGENVHHVGLMTERGTVIHSSSAMGCVVETALDDSWQLLAIHRYIEAAGEAEESEENAVQTYNMQVVLSDEDSTLNVRNEPGKGGDRIGRLSHGAVVTVLAEFDNGWRFVTYGDGASGYVDGSYLQPVTGTEGKSDCKTVTIVDSSGNRFGPVGDFRVLIGSVD